MVGGRLLLLVLVLAALAAVLALGLAVADPYSYTCLYQGANYTRAGAIQAQPIGPAFETCRETQGQIKTRSYPLGFSGSDSASGRGDLMTVQRSVGFSADVGGEGWVEYSYSLQWSFAVTGAPTWTGSTTGGRWLDIEGYFVLDWSEYDPQPCCSQGCPGDPCMGCVVEGSTLSASASTQGLLTVRVSKGYFGPSLALVAGAVLWEAESSSGGGGGGGGQPKYLWRLRLESWPVSTTVQVGNNLYVTPVELTFYGSRDLSIRFYPNENYSFAYADVTVKSSPWVYSCAERDDEFRLYSGDFVLSVTTDKYWGKSEYVIEFVEPSKTRKLVRFCFLTVVIRAVLSNSTLTVETNIDDLRSEAAVKWDGEWVETPLTRAVYGSVVLEALHQVPTDIWSEVEPETIGLPSGWMTPRACGPYATECEFSSESLTGEYIVTFEWRAWYSTIYTLIEVYAGDRLVWRSPYQATKKPRTETLSITFSNEPLRFVLYRLRGYLGNYPQVKITQIKKRLYAEFQKWVVYDEGGNEVLDPPANITVEVPAGRRWTAVAYYTVPGATLLRVESLPAGVEVLVNGTPYTTPFTLSEGNTLFVLLEAPPRWGGYVFVNWTVYDSSGSIVASSLSPAFTVSVPSGEFYRGVAYYEVSYEFRRIPGNVYYLGYQWLNTTAVTLSPGLWIVDSGPVPPNPSNETLVYATLLAANGSYMLVPATRLLVNVTEPTALPTLNCSGEYCEPKLVVEALNYSGYYLVGLGVGDWTKPAETEGVLRSLLLDNGTTLAVYNVTLLNMSGGVKYWLPVIVTSVKVELDALYAEEGVYLVWNVSYSHLAPEWVHSWLNVTEAKPYQLLKCRLYRGGRKLWEQDLGVLPEGLDYLFEDPAHSYAGLYVSYEELREKFGFDVAVLEAKVEWEAIHVPLAQSVEVRFVPAGIELRSLDQSGETWRWEVAPVEIPGNTPGPYIATGGEFVVVFNGTRRTLELSEDQYAAEFTTPPFEIGHRTLVVYFLPRLTRNLVYYFYPFEF